MCQDIIYSSTLLEHLQFLWELLPSSFLSTSCYGHCSSFGEGFCNRYDYFSPAIILFVLHAFEQPLWHLSSFPCSSLIIFPSIQFHIHNDSLDVCFTIEILYSDMSFSEPPFMVPLLLY